MSIMSGPSSANTRVDENGAVASVSPKAPADFNQSRRENGALFIMLCFVIGFFSALIEFRTGERFHERPIKGLCLFLISP